MSICCLYNDQTNALLGVSENAIEPQDGQAVIWLERSMPNLAYEEWNTATLMFYTRDCVVLSKLKFMQRFTAAEYAAIKNAAAANAEVDFFWQKFMAAQEIVLDDPDLVTGMAALVTAGLLTAARRDEILT